jgi:hypothetical protein
MKLILDAQQDFINQSAANEPSFAATKKDGEFQLNFQFGDFVTKLKEIGNSFKNTVSDGPLGKAIAGQFDAQDTNWLSGVLEGLGLDDVAAKYIDNRRDDREKEQFVQKFMNENPAAQVLSAETARAAAEEEYRMMRDGTKPMGTSLTEPMDKETALEQAEITQNQVELDQRMTSDIADLKVAAEQQLPMFRELQRTAEDMLLQLQIIAQNINQGGSNMFLPDGGNNDKKPKKRGRVPGGARDAVKPAAAAVGLMGRAAPGVGTALAVGSAGYDVYQREQDVDAGLISREEATKENTKDVAGTGTGLAAAGVVGLKATALAAPVVGPFAPVVGGIAALAAFYFGDAVGRAVTETIQESGNSTDISGSTDMMDPEQMIFAAPLDSTVPAQSTSNQLEKQTGGGGMEIQQSTQNNVNAPTTVINNNTNMRKTPRNEEPTFDRYTQQRAYP